MNTHTSIPTLSARDRRTLTIGGILIGTVLVAGRGVPIWHEWTRDTQASAIEVSVDAARADSVLAAAPTIHDSLLARSRRMMAMAPLIVRGGTPASAAATLASMIADAAADAGVTLGALQPRVNESAPLSPSRQRSVQRQAFVRVTVHGDLAGDIVGIAQFLGDLERDQTIVSMRELTISQPEPMAATNRMEILHAEFTATGLALAPAEAVTTRSPARLPSGLHD